MRIISTRVHGVLDYLMGLLIASSPWLFGFADTPTGPSLHLLIGAAILVAAAMTDFELGLIRVVPMPVHLMLDAGIGIFAVASPWLFGFESYAGLHVILGVLEIGVATMTSTRPAMRAARA